MSERLVADYERVCPLCDGTGLYEPWGDPQTEMRRLTDTMKRQFGWSRQKQAKMLGVSRRAISAWLSGETKPTVDHLETARILVGFHEEPHDRPRRSSYGPRPAWATGSTSQDLGDRSMGKACGLGDGAQ